MARQRKRSYRQRQAFKGSTSSGGQVAKPRSFERLRIDHSAKLTPRLRRRLSAAPSAMFALEARAFPDNMVNGSILERIVAKQVSDRGYRFTFQEVVTLGTGTIAKLDVAVYGTGIGQSGKPIDIEAQGLVWHTDRENDYLRRMQLKLAGIEVFNVWEPDLVGPEDVMHEVIDDVLRGIERPAPIEMPQPISFD
jgi:hypothetical protein